MKKKKIIYSIFLGVLLGIIILFVASVIRTNEFNQATHTSEFQGYNLFTAEPDKKQKVTVNVTKRSSTWGKIFDFYSEGITENNYSAYTYDFFVKNNTKVEVKSFSFKLVFGYDAYISSAWNGALEIHQYYAGHYHSDIIPDLRDYKPEDYDINLNIIKVDSEPLIEMHKGDFIIYHPSDSLNALEMPIKPNEGTTPGMIIYVKNGESIESSSLTLTYKLHMSLAKDSLFWVSITLLIVWHISLLILVITSLQARKYKILHERDNKIINESIETFTGFIDAKDPYTNGHSKRVAIYTKLIAEQMGFQGEELDRIYFIALLHDCGKIGVPDNILGKPGKLTDEEFEIIKSHTVRGGEILLSFKSLEKAHEGALYHHERYDGRGYPEGLAGENIPLIARMICVADSFDAMNSSRVYRKRLSKDYIINELNKNKGTQFDPNIAEIMLKLILEGKVKMDD